MFVCSLYLSVFVHSSYLSVFVRSSYPFVFVCSSYPSVFAHLVDVGAFVLTGGVVLMVMVVVLAHLSFNPLAFRSLLYLVVLVRSLLCLMVAACSFVLGLVVWACWLF